jgi:hypothetical protein
MNKLLVAMIIGISAFSVSAFAEKDIHAEMFPKKKQVEADSIQGRITILQTALTCVNAATSHDQMKSCHEKAHDAMESLEKQKKTKMEALKS